MESSSSSSSSSGLSSGAYAGIAVGFVLTVVIIAIAMFVVYAYHHPTSPSGLWLIEVRDLGDSLCCSVL